MYQHFGKQPFDQYNTFLKDGSVQAFVDKSLIASKDFYDKTTALATQGAKTLAEITETAWGSTKMLNEKVAQNVSQNFEAAFTAAHDIATAKSLPEMARLQSEYFQKLAAQATEQTKEFVDLSARATQHVCEKVRAAAIKPFKPAL
jgi:phasin family protein